MGDLINLNRVRKARTKAERTARAEANRAKYGRTKAEKADDVNAKARLERMLDGARRDDEA